MSSDSYFEFDILVGMVGETCAESKKHDTYDRVDTNESGKKKRVASNLPMKNEEEKRKLLEVMKDEELIWNKQHELHLNISALNAAWKRTAERMPEMTVADCKVIWKSLKDALRYRKKIASREKSEGGQEDSNEGEERNELDDMWSLLPPSNSEATKKTSISDATEDDEISDTRKLKRINDPKIQKVKSDQEKRKLILLVRKEDLIWNKQHKLHCNPTALNAAWNRIAKEMNSLTVLQCKAIWKSIKDALRYRKKAAAKRKSHDGAEEDHIQEVKEIKKENVLSNLSSTPSSSKQSKKTLPSGIIDNSEAIYSKPVSNRSYDTEKDKADELFESLGSISKAISELVTLAISTQVAQIPPSFKYEYIWRLIESLYAQMDESVINQVNQQIINLVYHNCKPEQG